MGSPEYLPGAERVVCDTCGITFIRARRKLAAAQRRRFCSTTCRDAPSPAETRTADRFTRDGQRLDRTR